MKTLDHLSFPAALLALVACGDSGGGAKGDTSQTTSDAQGDGADTAGDTSVVLPTDCFLPAAPTAAMDCALMCEKVEACGIGDEDCLADCSAYNYLLAPDAGERVEACFVDSPCNGHPAALGAIGCIGGLADDASYTPPAGNAAACAALEAKATTCGLSSELTDQIGFLCDTAGPALDASIMARADACKDEACDGFVACLDASSCVWSDLAPDEEIPVIVDGCTDSGDTTEIATEPVVSLAAACVTGCADGTFTCARDCLVDGTDLSAECSGCFALHARCVAAECDDACAADPAAAGCWSCQADAGCLQSFATCAGVPLPGSPDDLDVCDADDRVELAGEDMLRNIVSCVSQCQDGKTCADDCMEAVVFEPSPPCVDCLGDLIVCVGATCEAACDDFDDTPACYRCVAATECLGPFEACSGVGIAAPEGGLCLGPADVTRAEDGSAWQGTATCMKECAADATCLGACLADDTSVSATCRPCYADFGVCVDACSAPCERDAASPECASCIGATSCTDTFVACGGLPPYDPPAPGTADCATSVACAVACSGVAAAGCVEACIQATAPAELTLAREVSTCLRETCAGKDLSCLALECLSEFQTCHDITGELGCTDLGTCLGACATGECQADCFTRAATDKDAERLVAMNDCVGRFCAPEGGAPAAGCAQAVLEDVALCGAYAGVCADPDFDPGPADCGRVAACVSACPTVECADACVPEGLAGTVNAQLAAYFGCIQSECPDGELVCIVDACWGEFNTCYGEPGVALTCQQVVDCDGACESYSCGQRCLGSAASDEVAVGHEALLACIREHCLGPDGGLLEGCETTAINEGGSCHNEALACLVPE